MKLEITMINVISIRSVDTESFSSVTPQSHSYSSLSTLPSFISLRSRGGTFQVREVWTFKQYADLPSVCNGSLWLSVTHQSEMIWGKPSEGSGVNCLASLLRSFWPWACASTLGHKLQEDTVHLFLQMGVWCGSDTVDAWMSGNVSPKTLRNPAISAPHPHLLSLRREPVSGPSPSSLRFLTALYLVHYVTQELATIYFGYSHTHFENKVREPSSSPGFLPVPFVRGRRSDKAGMAFIRAASRVDSGLKKRPGQTPAYSKRDWKGKNYPFPSCSQCSSAGSTRLPVPDFLSKGNPSHRRASCSCMNPLSLNARCLDFNLKSSEQMPLSEPPVALAFF